MLRLARILAALVALSYLGRAAAVAASPEADRAIGPLLGGHTFYNDAIELVSGSIVGLGAAIALLVAAFASLHGRGRGLSATFAFTAGLSFPGFLQTLDLVLGLQESSYVAYVIQGAIAFVACIAAFAVTALGQRSIAPALAG